MFFKILIHPLITGFTGIVGVYAHLSLNTEQLQFLDLHKTLLKEKYFVRLSKLSVDSSISLAHGRMHRYGIAHGQRRAVRTDSAIPLFSFPSLELEKSMDVTQVSFRSLL